MAVLEGANGDLTFAERDPDATEVADESGRGVARSNLGVTPALALELALELGRVLGCLNGDAAGVAGELRSRTDVARENGAGYALRLGSLSEVDWPGSASSFPKLASKAVGRLPRGGMCKTIAGTRCSVSLEHHDTVGESNLCKFDAYRGTEIACLVNGRENRPSERLVRPSGSFGRCYMAKVRVYR